MVGRQSRLDNGALDLVTQGVLTWELVRKAESWATESESAL